MILQSIGMVEFILCYGAPALNWGLLLSKISKDGQGQHSMCLASWIVLLNVLYSCPQGSIFWSINDIYSPPPQFKRYETFPPLALASLTLTMHFCLYSSLFAFILPFYFPFSLFLSPFFLFEFPFSFHFLFIFFLPILGGGGYCLIL